MTKKKIASISTVSLAAVVATAALLYSPSGFKGKVDCVHTAQVGELVVLTAAEASAYQWEVLPDNKNYVINGKTLIFSAQEVGEYIFICAMAKKGKVELVIHKVIVKSYSRSIKKLISQWLPSNYDEDEANRLAAAFKRSAAEALTVEELISKSAEYNKTAISDLDTWRPFLQKVSSYCQENLSSSSLSEHKDFWNNVASALTSNEIKS